MPVVPWCGWVNMYAFITDHAVMKTTKNKRIKIISFLKIDK